MNRSRWKRALQRVPIIYELALVAGKAIDIRRGSWVEPELTLLRELVKPGERAVDVGANYGLWSWHLARAVGPTGDVVAFEPIPGTAKALRRVLWLLGLSGRVDVCVAACGERPGRATFRVPTVTPDGPIIAGLAHMAGIEGPGDWATTEAHVVRLDDVVRGSKVALVKIDTEGAELFALRGASRLLAQQQPTVICEIGRGLLRERYGIEATQLVELMEQHDYEILRLSNGGLTRADVAEQYDGNYIFVSPRYRERVAAYLAP